MKRKIFSILFALVLVLSLSLIPAVPVAAAGPITKNYGDITLPSGGGFFLQPDIWDLNACEVTVSYTLDLSGAPNVAYTGNYGQSGYVGLVWPGSPWAGAWMSGFLCDWYNASTEFPTYPDIDDNLDMDDKFNMQRSPNPGSWSETMYDVYCETNTIADSPFGSGDNYGIWFDRDGVDPYQPDMWGAVDGGTYNTGGVYDVEILYHKASSTEGTACPLFFPSLENNDAPGGYGVPTGFDRQSDGSYADFPAGISFDTDETKMTMMQVIVSGNSGDGTIVVKDLTVTGCLATPMALKTEAAAELDSIDPTGDKKVDKKIDKAMEHLDKSLDGDLWVDETHLEEKHGKKVFDEEKKTVKELMHLIDKKGTPDEVKEVCQSVISKLVMADSLLARTAYEEAQDYAGDPKVDKELEKCEKEFTKADEELAKGKYDKAIKHYKKAWEHAQKALGKAP